MPGQWCGHFGLEHTHPVPELFLYSKKDFYLPYKYLEDVVLASRKGREFKVQYNFYQPCNYKVDLFLESRKGREFKVQYSFHQPCYYKVDSGKR